MTYYTWAEETQARELAEMQRNNALARVKELEDEAAKLRPSEIKLWNVNAALQRRQEMAADCIADLLGDRQDEKLRKWSAKLVEILRSKVVVVPKQLS